MNEKKYRKTVVELTVLHPIEDVVEGLDLEDVASEIDDGAWVGSVKTLSTTDLDRDEVVPELRALGNDGSFFATTDDPADLADAGAADGG